MIFAEAYEKRMLDRPVELVIRMPEGLPRGNVRDVVTAYRELVQEGCVLILGPLISENAVDLKIYVDSAPVQDRVPYVGSVGTEDCLSEWGFELNNGGHPEEAATIASIMEQDGIRSTAILLEQSLIGQHYTKFFKDAAELWKIDIKGTFFMPQVEGGDKSDVLKQARDSGAESVLVLGFGYGVAGVNAAMEKIGWVVPRYTVTNFLTWHFGTDWQEQMRGWIGLDQYDERNQVGQRFLDRFEAKHGARPAYFWGVYTYDQARIAVEALRRAEPLGARGVRDSLERVKGLPAASGAPGTWLKFGKYVHQGWMGAGFLVARKISEDGSHHVFHGTIEPPNELPL
ncbi:ABC transporter substrate-binding protein [Tardibacter chloracetimidivorans]|nr:ABC transporter substrate-binding protein [Tardibacter chloracetimidivorans]